MTKTDFQFKHQRAMQMIDNAQADALYLWSTQNREWYSGFNSSLGFLYITKNKSVLFVDGRYIEAAKKYVYPEIEVIYFTSSSQINDFLIENKIKKVAIEQEYLTYEYDNFFKQAKIQIIPCQSQMLRAVKTLAEIKLIQKAVDITCEVANKLKKYLKPGMTEIDVSNWITIQLIKHGAVKNSFDPIVASGVNGSCPHHHSSNKKLMSGEFVTCDFGCIYEGFCSDLTRTYVLGKPKSQRMVNLYRTVQKSNALGRSLVNSKAIGCEIHQQCAQVIDNTEFKGCFIHGTGHGVGLDVHEMPMVNAYYTLPLAENSIVTIEPGIYVAGLGGVRIEDMMLVKNKNSIHLTSKAEVIKV